MYIPCTSASVSQSCPCIMTCMCLIEQMHGERSQCMCVCVCACMCACSRVLLCCALLCCACWVMRVLCFARTVGTVQQEGFLQPLSSERRLRIYQNPREEVALGRGRVDRPAVQGDVAVVWLPACRQRHGTKAWHTITVHPALHDAQGTASNGNLPWRPTAMHADMSARHMGWACSDGQTHDERRTWVSVVQVQLVTHRSGSLGCGAASSLLPPCVLRL